MQIIALLSFALLSLAVPNLQHPHVHAPQRSNKSSVTCPIIFDGRIPRNTTLQSFDSATTSSYSPDYVKGENTTWSSILLLPNYESPSRFDDPKLNKPLEVTIDNRSLFRAGQDLQVGFRRAGLLLKDDANEPGADASDAGVVTFHWSVKQDALRPLNLSHEYMNVWHEKADYSGNQFMFVCGVVLVGDGGTGIDTKVEREQWRVQNWKNEFIFAVPMDFERWQNFAVQLDYVANTIQVFYSTGHATLKAATRALRNENGGGGQLQIGIAKKPTETETVVFDGYHESIPLRGEGQIYGGIFVEESDDGCISL